MYDVVTHPVTIMSVLAAMYWTLVTEFSYLGRIGKMCMRFTYSISASAYDLKWKADAYRSPEITKRLFLDPLKENIGESPDVRVADLACGTGRMSLMLLSQPWFHGKVEAADFATGMLQKFDKKTAGLTDEQRGRMDVKCENLNDWAPVESSYDTITMMEVSQFLPNLEEIVGKVRSAIKPGGLFLLTRAAGFYSYALPSRSQSREEMQALLNRSGFENVKIKKWESRHDVVYAYRKHEDDSAE